MKPKRKKLRFLGLCMMMAILFHQYWTEIQSMKKEATSISVPINVESIPQRYPEVPMNEQEKQTYSHYSEFQQLNDNMTYVYAGYYDDREEKADVKVIAMIPRESPYFNFACIVYYPDQTEVQAMGYVKYHYAPALANTLNNNYRNGYIICPVAKKKGSPTSLALGIKGTAVSKTKIKIWSPRKENNKVIRCISPLIKNFDDVSRLIWNIELFRMFGVDKHIIYMESQTERIVDVVRSYANDGIVEIRNFSISQQEAPIGQFMKHNAYWAQWSAYHDCLLSQMKSAKYVMLFDVDEILVPRKHKSIVDMADELFAQTKRDPKPAGALIFRNVFYPTFKNMTSRNFPGKDLALKYKIHPLLCTTRMKTNEPFIRPKSLVRPESVDVMFIHYVEVFKKGWRNKIVDEDIASMHHYRNSPDYYMYPPETEDDYMLQFSDQLISVVKQRFKKTL